VRPAIGREHCWFYQMPHEYTSYKWHCCVEVHHQITTCVCVTKFHSAYFAIKPNVEEEAVHVSTNEVRANEMGETQSVELTACEEFVVIIN